MGEDAQRKSRSPELITVRMENLIEAETPKAILAGTAQNKEGESRVST